MKNTYKYLRKMQKDTIDCIDVANMEEMLKRGYFNNFVWAYDTLSNIYQEGIVRLNDDQNAVLLLPLKKWGSKSGAVLYNMRKDMWAEIKKDRCGD
jgi:hypothetical protein